MKVIQQNVEQTLTSSLVDIVKRNKNTTTFLDSNSEVGIYLSAVLGAVDAIDNFKRQFIATQHFNKIHNVYKSLNAAQVEALQVIRSKE